MSKKILNRIQNHTYFFSPYGDYENVESPLYKEIYGEILKNLAEMSWLSSISSHDYEKIDNAWNEIQFNINNE